MGIQSPEGMVFAGKYRINKMIGRGGMANVYLATDMGSGLKVAIKVLKPEFSADEEFIRRFDTEAKAVSSLNHANIVKVYGVGHEGNFRFIVQEYIEGITVKDLINQNGHIDWRVAVPICIQVAMALDYAHNNGIVHRDIKPQNILISRDRIAKITDFGIARAMSNNTITMSSGGAIGSVHYFSPEQAKGGNVGPSSDIYSIGVMLFEMVTGRVPFDGDSNVAIAVKHLQEQPPKASSYIPELPSGLDAIINKCMQKTPDRRYMTMRQLVTELDALLIDPSGIYGVIEQPRYNNNSNPVPENNEVSFRQDPSYERISEIERAAEARRFARIRDSILLTLIIVCIVAVVIGIGVLVLNSISNTTDKVQNNTVKNEFVVGNYVGKTKAEVERELKNEKDLNVEYVPKKTNEKVEGVILEQNIKEGTSIKNTQLVLTYAVPEDSIVLQDYAQADFRVAQASLENLNLKVSLITEAREDMEPGIVIRTEPAAGSSVKPDDTVIVVYSKEPESAVVPNIMGRTLEQARQDLEDNGLTLGTIEGSEEVRALPESEQIVMLTNPVAGISLQRRGQVQIYVGNNEDWARGGTPTPTPAMVWVYGNVEGPGIVIGGGQYLPDSQVTLTAEPNEGSRFDHWRDIYGNVVSVQPSYTFRTGQTEASFTAVFMPLPTPTPEPVETTPPPPPETSETNPPLPDQPAQ